MDNCKIKHIKHLKVDKLSTCQLQIGQYCLHPRNLKNGDILTILNNTLTFSTPKTIGHTGPVGPPGSNGLAGPAGPQGPTGSPGTDGVDGDVGDVGEPGTTGVVGITGASGLGGEIGSIGVTGSNGQPGPVGANGDAGADGVDGPVGNAGVRGFTGAAGNNGDPGADGSDGVAGSTGPSGSDVLSPGPTGAIGDTGSPGPAGTDGNNGADGVTGSSGPTGDCGCGEFNCVEYNYALQLLRNSSTAPNYQIFRLNNGDWEALPTPIIITENQAPNPDMVKMNGAAMSPNNALYAQVSFAPEAVGDTYLARIAEDGTLTFVLRFMNTQREPNGCFDSVGNYYYATGVNLYKIDAASITGGGPLLGDATQITVNNTGTAFMNNLDMVWINAEAAYGLTGVTNALITIEQPGDDVLGIYDLDTDTNYTFNLNPPGTMDPGTPNYGAAFNFGGDAFFSANSGEGMFRIDTVDNVTGVYTFSQVNGTTINTNENDGMNPWGCEELPPLNMI